MSEILKMSKEEREQFILLMRKYVTSDPMLDTLIHDIRKSLTVRGAKLWDEHHGIVESFASWMEPNTYVEIGANHGQTFNRVAPYAKRAVAVEIKEGLHKDLVELDHVEKFAMSSNEFAKVWNDKIDLLFIDGEHSHDQSMRDFLHFSRFVPEDGLILMHDTYPPSKEWTVDNKCHEVYKTAWFIRHELSNQFEIATLPLEYGISIVRRVSAPMHWAKGKVEYDLSFYTAALLLKMMFVGGITGFARKVKRKLSR